MKLITCFNFLLAIVLALDYLPIYDEAKFDSFALEIYGQVSTQILQRADIIIKSEGQLQMNADLQDHSYLELNGISYPLNRFIYSGGIVIYFRVFSPQIMNLNLFKAFISPLKPRMDIQVYVQVQLIQQQFEQIVKIIPSPFFSILLKPEPAITSQLSSLLLQAVQNFDMEYSDRLSIDAPYRDSNGELPSLLILQSSNPDCEIIFGSNEKKQLICYLIGNRILITGFPQLYNSGKEFQIIIQQFINYNSLQPQMITIQFEKSIIDKYVAIRRSKFELKALTPTILDVFIGYDKSQVNNNPLIIFTFMIYDFITKRTDLKMIFADDFLTQNQIITINGLQNMPKQVTFSISENQLVFLSPFNNDIYYGIIKFSIEFQPFQQSKLFQNNVVTLEENNYIVSKNAKVQIETTTNFKGNCILKLLSYTKGETSDHTFNFKFSQQIQLADEIKVQFNYDPQFPSQCNLCSSEGFSVMGQCKFQESDLIIPVKNIDKSIISFCVRNLVNPLLKPPEPSYRMLILQQGVIQSDCYNDLEQNYNPARMRFYDIKQSSQTVMTTDNILSFSFWLNFKFLPSDILRLQFNVFDFPHEQSSTQISCELQKKDCLSCEKIQANCILFTKHIEIQVKELKEQIQYEIKIFNFMSNRSLKPSSKFLLQKLTNNQVVEEASSESGIMVSNTKQFLNVELHTNNPFIELKFDLKLCFTSPIEIIKGDILQVDLKLETQMEAKGCQSDLFSEFSKTDEFLYFNVSKKLNKLQRYCVYCEQISNKIYKKNLENQTINLLDSDFFPVLTWINYEGFNFQQKQFKEASLYPQSNLVGEQSIYVLKFSTSFYLEKNQKIVLNLETSFSLGSLITCTSEQPNTLINCTPDFQIDKTAIIFQFQDLSVDELHVIYINKIFNPKKDNLVYYADLIRQVENLYIIERSQIKLPKYLCADSNCKLCSSIQCEKCAFPYLIQNGLCVLQCPSGYIIIDQKCVKCLQNCEICSTQNPSNCIQCLEGFDWNDNRCILNQEDNSLQSSQKTDNTPKNFRNNQINFSFETGFLTYFTIFIFLITIIYKIFHPQLGAISIIIVYFGLTYQITRILSFLFYLEEKAYLQGFLQMGIQFCQIVQNSNFKLQFINLINADKKYIDLLKINTLLQVGHLLISNYDSRIAFIFNSRLRENKLFDYKFEDAIQVQNVFLRGVIWSLIIIFPCSIFAQIFAITTSSNLQRQNIMSKIVFSLSIQFTQSWMLFQFLLNIYSISNKIQRKNFDLFTQYQNILIWKVCSTSPLLSLISHEVQNGTRAFVLQSILQYFSLCTIHFFIQMAHFWQLTIQFGKIGVTHYYLFWFIKILGFLNIQYLLDFIIYNFQNMNPVKQNDMQRENCFKSILFIDFINLRNIMQQFDHYLIRFQGEQLPNRPLQQAHFVLGSTQHLTFTIYKLDRQDDQQKSKQPTSKQEQLIFQKQSLNLFIIIIPIISEKCLYSVKKI